MIILPPLQPRLEFPCKAHVIFMTAAATSSILKVLPLILDSIVRTNNFLHYEQFHCNSVYNHLFAMVLGLEICPILGYETSTVYVQNPEKLERCDTNNSVTGYELYIVSILVYLTAVICIVYNTIRIGFSYRLPQNSEIAVMNKITVTLSVITLVSIVELNPCYDLTASFPDNNLLVDWGHHEKAFAYGIGIKQFIDSLTVLFILYISPKDTTRLTARENILRRNGSPSEKRGFCPRK